MSATSSSDGLRDLAPGRALRVLAALAAQRLLARHARRRGPPTAHPPRPAAARPSGPAAASSSTSARPSPASTSRSATAWSTSFPQRRAAAMTAPAVSSAVATPVIRSTSSCASSTITTSCSGSTGRPSSASMASSAWLVTTTSARPASRAGLLREAVVADRAARGAQALAGADRHLPPRRLGHARDELVAVAGLGVAAPLVDALDRAARARRPRRGRTAGPRRRRRRRCRAACAGTGSCGGP